MKQIIKSTCVVATALGDIRDRANSANQLIQALKSVLQQGADDPTKAQDACGSALELLRSLEI